MSEQRPAAFLKYTIHRKCETICSRAQPLVSVLTYDREQRAFHRSEFINFLPVACLWASGIPPHGTNGARAVSLQRMAANLSRLLLFTLSLVLLGVEGGRFGGRGGGFGRGFGGGGGSRFGGRSGSSIGWGSSTGRRSSSWGGSWGGRSSSFGSRYSAPTGRYASYTPPVTRSYSGGYGRWV